jgi:hypothetical protein
MNHTRRTNLYTRKERGEKERKTMEQCSSSCQSRGYVCKDEQTKNESVKRGGINNVRNPFPTNTY